MRLGTWMFVSLCLLGLLTSTARAQPTISVVVIGPGDAAWERFGHIGVRVQDESRGLDAWFDWGRFDFGGPGFYWSFARGHMRYWMESSRAEPVIEFYASLDREVQQFNLNLDAEQSAILLDELFSTDTDENRFYAYGYYTNNCSTAVRDVIDRATGGQIKPQLVGKMTDESFRSVTRRLMYDNLGNTLQMLGADFVNGRKVDPKLDAWDASFTPMEFGRRLSQLRITHGDGGDRVPLVRESRTLNRTQSDRLIENDREPESMWMWLALPGVAIGGLTVLSRRLGRIRFVPLLAVTLFVAIAASMLIFMSFFTVHYATWPNENLLLASPLAWLVLLGTIVPRLRTVGRVAAVVSVVLSIVAVALKLDPASQQNAPWLWLFVPLHVAVAIVLLTTPRRDSSLEETNPETPCPSSAAAAS